MIDAVETESKTSSPEVTSENGLGLIRGRIRTLPEGPGVYRMLDEDSNPLYVGKAKNLKRRVVTYSRPDKLPIRLQRQAQEQLP